MCGRSCTLITMGANLVFIIIKAGFMTVFYASVMGMILSAFAIHKPY